jgi:type II secretion system protein I
MNCSRCESSTAGFTLIEVVVGLAIMAGVLVSSLLAFSSHRRAQQFAEAKVAAVAVTDELLTLFSGSPGGIPATGRGPIAGRPDWWWRSEVVGLTAPAGISLQVIRFQIIEINPRGRSRSLVSVDVVGGGS